MKRMRFGKHKKVKKKKIDALSAGDEKERIRAAMEAQYKRKPKKFYFRKNYRVARSGVESLFLLPMRLQRGPIYPTYNKRTEFWYRAVMKVADHHYLLSWDDLRNLYPIPPMPRASYVRKVTLPCGLRGEFVCWVPKKEAREIRRRESEYEEMKARHEKEGGDLPEESPYFRNKPTIMFIHGGGFCIGTVPSYRSWCWKLSKMLGGMQLFLVDYTLSPEVTFPVAIQQCWKAYLWLLNPQGGGIPADRLIIAGDSAGGNLTLSLLYVIRQVRLEKERSQILEQRQRRLERSQSSAGLPSEVTESRDQEQGVRKRKKGLIEEWIEKEREREEATIPSVQKLIEVRQKEKEQEEQSNGNDESDVVAADASSEARWPASNPTESKQRAWERRTLALDEKFMLKHQLPFEMDEEDKDIFPPQPLAALLLSPWVDLSEHSSVFFYRSYPRPEKFRPYHIGLRFVQGYLNLQPSDYPFTKRKERELRRAFRGGLKAQSQDKWTTREKDRARLKWEKKRWERKYLMRVMYEELRLRQVDRDERLHLQRRRQSLASLREEELEAICEKSSTDLATSGASSSAGGQPAHEKLTQMREHRARILNQLSQQREKEKNLTSIYSPYISPIYGDLLGLPPLLITGGDVEPLWEDIRRLHQKAQQQGIDVEMYVGHHMNHDFQFFFNVVPHPEVEKCFAYTKEYLHRQMNLRKEREASYVDLLQRSPASHPTQDTAGQSPAENLQQPKEVTINKNDTAKRGPVHGIEAGSGHANAKNVGDRDARHIRHHPFIERFDDEVGESALPYHTILPSLMFNT